MAIADGTAGAWTATTTRNPTATLVAHAAGDMLLVRMGWKSSTPTTDVAVCNTSGWAKVGQRYNGGGASANNGGGVLCALFWKVATSASETNPVIEFDDATAPTPGCYSVVSYTKGATEAWATPLGDGGDVAAATSYSGTAASHIAAASGDMLDAFVITNDNTTLTVPTMTQAGLTLDTVTEFPGTAGIFTDSNDISADGCNRLATAGTSSAAAVMTGTNSVADPGVAWITCLRLIATVAAAGSLSPAGAIVYRPSIRPAGTITSSGIQAVVAKVVQAGTSAISGLLARRPSISQAGSSSPTGALANLRLTILAVAGSISSSGTIRWLASALQGGSSSPAGALSRQPRIAQAGSSSPTGALTRAPHLTGLQGILGATGSLLRRPGIILAGASSPSGALGNILTKLLAIAGVVGPTGALSRAPRTAQAGSSSPTGSLTRRPHLTGLQGALTAAGSLIRRPILAIAGTLSPSGVLAALKTQILAIAGTITSSGVLARRPGVLQGGSLSPTGSVSFLQTLARAFGGSLSPTGAIGWSASHLLGGSITAAGSVAKLVAVRMAGIITLAGELLTALGGGKIIFAVQRLRSRMSNTGGSADASRKRTSRRN